MENKEIIDPSSIYNRLAKLSDSDWKQIIDLGEQTGTFSFNDISVIKTVIQKLTRKEDLDLNRLKITEEAISKLKKYGLNH